MRLYFSWVIVIVSIYFISTFLGFPVPQKDSFLDISTIISLDILILFIAILVSIRMGFIFYYLNLKSFFSKQKKKNIFFISLGLFFLVNFIFNFIICEIFKIKIGSLFILFSIPLFYWIVICNGFKIDKKIAYLKVRNKKNKKNKKNNK